MQELMVTAPGKLAWIDSPSPQLASPGGAIVRPENHRAALRRHRGGSSGTLQF